MRNGERLGSRCISKGFASVAESLFATRCHETHIGAFYQRAAFFLHRLARDAEPVKAFKPLRPSTCGELKVCGRVGINYGFFHRDGSTTHVLFGEDRKASDYNSGVNATADTL